MACSSSTLTTANSFPKYTREEFAKRRKFGENNINSGRLREFPWICIDKFFGDSLQATIFILSHCHTDHMVGLDEEEFWKRLNQPGVKLYLHKITPMLIPLFKTYLLGEEGIQMLVAQQKIIPLNTFTPVDIQDSVTGTTIKMTLLPAGHCPGSVMFQFDYDDQCTLYTADCRISVDDDLKEIESLHILTQKPDGAVERIVKPITHLYIDTTFCSSRSQDFPGRADAVDRLIEIVQRWFSEFPNGRVNVSFAAKFSHEYVLKKCYEAFGIQFHVNSQRYNAYRQIPELLPAVTLNATTRFHLCEAKSPCLTNASGRSKLRILRVKLSSLWYMKNTSGFGPTRALKQDGDAITLCYAMHSSLDEIGAIINYLKPKVVTPLVLPQGMPRKNLEVELRLNTWGNFVYEDYQHGLASKTILKVFKQQLEVDVPIKRDQQNSPSFCNQETASKKRRRDIHWTPSPSPPPI